MWEMALFALSIGPTVYFAIIVAVGLVVMVGFTIRIFISYIYHAIREDRKSAVEHIERKIG